MNSQEQGTQESSAVRSGPNWWNLSYWFPENAPGIASQGSNPSVRYTPTWLKWVGAGGPATIGAAAGYLLTKIFGQLPEHEQHHFELEASKALFELIGVLVFGTFVSLGIKYFDNTKKADKSLLDFRMEFLDRLRSFDESVKKARTLLRSQGLTNQFGTMPKVLTQNQIVAYDSAFELLQDSSIGIDRLIEEMTIYKDAFSDRAALLTKLGEMSILLRNLVDEYEEFRGSSNTQIPSTSLTNLVGFTGRSATNMNTPISYVDWVKRYDSALVAIRKDILPLKAVIVLPAESAALPPPSSQT